MASIFKRQIVLGPRKPRGEAAISELFHENTKLVSGVQGGGLVPGDYSLDEMKAMASVGRSYPRARKLALPAPAPSTRSFDEVVTTRRSVRDFAAADLTQAELSRLCHHASGITGETRLSDGTVQPFRAAPSAGGLYPVEIYLGVRRVEGVAPGIYHYNVRQHALEQLADGDPTQALYDACCFQEFARTASVVFLFAGVLERTKRKYGERGYRYVLLDTGHLVENLWLSASAIGLGCVTTCGFFDDVANRLVGIDGVTEVVTYCGFVGRPARKVAPTKKGAK